MISLLAKAAAAKVFEKQALTVERGGLPSRVLASTLGEVGNALELGGPLISLRSFVNPNVAKHTERAQQMAKAEPEALSNTKLRLGGTDLVDDMIWKRETADHSLPWYKQIGGRVMHNPRTTIAGKALGEATLPLSMLMANVLRGSNYNPTTDVASQYWDELPVTEHELGHAIDFNQLPVTHGQGVRGALKNYGKAVLRDLYTIIPMAASQLPFNVPVNVPYEALANWRSHRALKKVLSPEELRKAEIARDKVLPAAFGSYVGAAATPLTGPMGPLLGVLAGRIAGRSRALWRETHPGDIKNKKSPQNDEKHKSEHGSK